MIKNILMISSLAALTTLAACSDDGKDSGDTGTTSGTTTATTTTMTGTTVPMLAIDLVEYPSCAGDTWTYYVETIAWTDGNNIVNAWETGVTGGYNDEHTMTSCLALRSPTPPKTSTPSSLVACRTLTPP